jgi:hypothetical protein
MNAYLCYHQISLVIDDEKNIFHHPIWSLLLHKDGGATYHSAIHIILESQIGRNVDAYIDDV